MSDLPARVRAAVLAHPATVLLAFVLAGLVLGPRSEAPLVPVALVAGLVSGTPLRTAVLLVALLAGAVWGHARTATLDRSALGPLLGHVVRADAGLLESPRATAFGWRAAARLHGGSAPRLGARQVISAIAPARGEGVLLRGPGRAPPWSAGDIVAVRGALQAPGPRDAWLRPKGLHAVLEATVVRSTGLRRGGAAGLLDDVRRRAQRALTERLPPPEGALLRGMVLGDDSALDVAERERLRRAGLGHLVAASGANVALLAALALAACSLLGVGLRARLLIVLALIALYVPLAGGGPSIRRAGVMGAAGIVAMLAARPAMRWHVVLLAAVVTLALDPRALTDPGWQLSFAAVIAIALLGAPLRRMALRRGVPAILAEGGALTLAATVGTAPVSAAVFGTVSLAGILANVIVAPLVGPITWLGMVAACAGQLWPAAGGVIGALAGPLVGAVLAVGRFGSALPAAQVNVAVPVALAGALAVTGLVLWAPARRAAVVLAPLLALGVAVGVVLLQPRPIAQPAPGVLRMAFLDVGQGDATLIQSGSHAMLVDSGPPDGPILQRLKRLGIRRLDVLVGTHAQADHIGGADHVLRALPVTTVLDGRDGVREQQGDELARAAAETGARLVPAVAGQRIRLGDVTAEVLSPPRRERAPVAGADPNQRAIVLRVTGAGTRLLLTADAESDVVGPLDPGLADVLKVGHHGSADPGLPALLTRLRPRIAVIEVGLGNTYGHPAASTLGALRDAGAAVRRTDRDGTVIVDAERGLLSVHART